MLQYIAFHTGTGRARASVWEGLGCTQGHSGGGGVVVDPEGDPGEDGDQDGGHVGLQDEVSDVPLQLEAQGEAWVGA